MSMWIDNWVRLSLVKAAPAIRPGAKNLAAGEQDWPLSWISPAVPCQTQPPAPPAAAFSGGHNRAGAGHCPTAGDQRIRTGRAEAPHQTSFAATVTGAAMYQARTKALR